MASDILCNSEGRGGFAAEDAAGLKAHKPARFPVVLAVIWVAAIAVVMVMILNYTNTSGGAGNAPTQWPAESRIPLDPARPNLILFAHPLCPCTRATIGELEVLMARARGRLSAQVWFIRPAGTTSDWAETDLWRRAAAIPGVTVHEDDELVEAGHFHAETSGQAVFYDPAGKLLFQGGITVSRGHSGDNPGRAAVENFLTNRVTTTGRTPVFGCPLSDLHCQEGGASCKR